MVVLVADLNSISGLTTGKITGAVSDNTIAALEGITESGNALTIVVKDSTVDVTKLAIAKTTSTNCRYNNYRKLAEINTAIASTSYTGVKNNNVIVTDAITAAQPENSRRCKYW